MTPATLQTPDQPLVTPDAPIIPGDRSVAESIKPMRSNVRRLKYMALWARQMQVLLRSGTPLADALRAVGQQAPDVQWRTMMNELCLRVDEGAGLSDAMRDYPTYFDPVSRSLVAAGETAGKLDCMLERLTTLSRQQLRIRRSVIGALVYPCILIFVAVSVMVVMIGFVLPRFSELFSTLDVPLPPTTALLVSVSDVFRGYWWAMLGAVIAGVVGLRMGLRSEGGRAIVDRWLVSMPYFGATVRNFATARLARILGVLVQGHVPLLEALDLTKASTTNREYARLVEQTHDAVAQGNDISAVFARSDLINPSVSEAIRHGEQNGQVGLILTDMAEFMDEENESFVKTLSSVLEPIILIILGAIVAFVALSMFLPLFDLTTMT